ncbi:MAG: hypothetical protein QXX95_03075 [Nitrososphaerales archaeon]
MKKDFLVAKFGNEDMLNSALNKLKAVGVKVEVRDRWTLLVKFFKMDKALRDEVIEIIESSFGYVEIDYR